MRRGGRRRLHGLLLKAAYFEIHRRRAGLPHLSDEDFDDLANQSADDAMVAILAKLGTYRGNSRFTTWAYKFALLEAGVKLRRRAWHGREVSLEPEHWAEFAHQGISPTAGTERREFFGVLVDWEIYLAPWINDIIPGNATDAMHLIGVVEIIAGLAVAVKPRYGAYVVAAWLGGIIVNLLTLSGYYDVALRDFGLMVGALTLARLASKYDEPGFGFKL